jgi:putative endonuclease
MPLPWHVYILECADGSYYCGVTTDLARRLARHNGELPGGSRYTRGRRPVRLLASTVVADKAEACRLEWRIKRLAKSAKQSFILDHQRGIAS